MNELKTSDQWQELCTLTVFDPDGWDRKNFDYSWHKELITKSEFERRMASSTIMGMITDSIWIELLPCPICGRSAEISSSCLPCTMIKEYGITCTNALCGIHTRSDYQSLSEVVDVWNDRVKNNA